MKSPVQKAWKVTQKDGSSAFTPIKCGGVLYTKNKWTYASPRGPLFAFETREAAREFMYAMREQGDFHDLKIHKAAIRPSTELPESNCQEYWPERTIFADAVKLIN